MKDEINLALPNFHKARTENSGTLKAKSYPFNLCTEYF